jgi:hypothetical protein
VDELSADVRDWLKLVRFAGLAFSASAELWPEEWFTEVEP